MIQKKFIETIRREAGFRFNYKEYLDYLTRLK